MKDREPTDDELRSASITRLLSLMRCACGGYRFDDPRFVPTCRCATTHPAERRSV